jgi:hypothetical protein
MSSSTSKDVFKHPKGSFDRINTTNYASWQNSIRRLLRMMSCWEITTGDEEIPPLAPAGSPANIASAARKAKMEFEQRREEAASMIYNA